MRFGSFVCCLAFGVGAMAMAPAAFADPPHLSIGFRTTKLNKDGCVRRAETVLRDAGFGDVRRSASGTAVFGVLEDYRGAVQCAPGSVFFTVAGPSSDKNNQYHDKIQKGF